MTALQLAASFGFVVAAATTTLGLEAPGLSREWQIAHYTRRAVRQDRDCKPAASPRVLPAAASLIDVGAVQRAIAADSASVPSVGSTFSLRFAGNGQSEWVEVIAGPNHDSRDPRLQTLIARHVRPQALTKEPWGVRLKVVPGDTIGYEVSRSEFCPVERIVRRNVAREMVSGIATMEEINELRNSGEVRVVVDVSATGQIVRVALVQSSGSRIADDNALHGLRDAAFRPALVDGIPVAGRYEHNSRSTMRRIR